MSDSDQDSSSIMSESDPDSSSRMFDSDSGSSSGMYDSDSYSSSEMYDSDDSSFSLSDHDSEASYTIPDSGSDSSFRGDAYGWSSSLDHTPEFKQRRKDEKKNPFFLQDCSDWLVVLEQYIKEAKPTSIVLGALGMKTSEVVSILKLVQNSEITDLSLQYNNLKGGMAEIAKLLVGTKIEKLDVSKCNLSPKDLLHLMEVLKDTQITNLDVSSNDKMDLRTRADSQKFLSYVLQSHLVTFKFDMNFGYDEEARHAFYRLLRKTSITCLDSAEIIWDRFLLSPALKVTQLTKLNFYDFEFQIEEVKVVSKALKDLQVKDLYLCYNKLTDVAVDILGQGLVQSKVLWLDLGDNNISGSNNLGSWLKNTRIENLHLSRNPIKCEKMFSFPDFLKDSHVTGLNVDECQLGDVIGQKLMQSLKFAPLLKHFAVMKNKLKSGSIAEFAKVVKYTNIIGLDFSCNNLTHDSLAVLGDSFKGSKLQLVHLCVNSFERKFEKAYHRAEVNAFATLLEKTKGSDVTTLDMFSNNFTGQDLDVIGASIENSPVTELKIYGNRLFNEGITNLALHLKLTSITRLDVSNNMIGDRGLENLCERLKETKIMVLDISQNSITCKGAKAIAPHLQGTSLISLKLGDNDIRNDGLQALAEGLENTFITECCVRRNPGHRKLVVSRVVYKNRIRAHQLVSSFKELVPQIQSSNFCLDEGVSNTTGSLEKHFLFFKTILDEPSSFNVFAEEASLDFTKEQLVSFLLEEFPRQLSFFIASQLEADLLQQILILKRVEELQLKPLVEHLLLNRPLYMIDEDQGILHPYVYQLLHKYKQPLYHSGIEPEGKAKLVSYFTDHAEMEGASGVVLLLNN